MRTTHMTGTVTDLGVVIGHYLRGNREITWKIKYYAMNISSFIMGGILVGVGLKYLGRNTLNWMSVAYIFNSIYYFLLRDRYYKIEK